MRASQDKQPWWSNKDNNKDNNIDSFFDTSKSFIKQPKQTPPQPALREETKKTTTTARDDKNEENEDDAKEYSMDFDDKFSSSKVGINSTLSITQQSGLFLHVFLFF